MKIVLIGAGNVSFHLGPLFRKKGHEIVQVFSRSEKSGKELAKKLGCKYVTEVPAIAQGADIYVVALRDEAIVPFLKAMTFIPRLIVHTSGSISIKVFPKRMTHCGVMYPLQTFSKSHRKTPEKIPFCVEGSSEIALKRIRSLAKSVSRSVHDISSPEREFIHLSAVFVNNFSNYLFVQASKILREKNIPFNLLRPLIEETALKVQSDEPSDMQTGPARRGDAVIISKHLKLLKEHPELKKIYRLFSENIERDFGPRL